MITKTYCNCVSHWKHIGYAGEFSREALGMLEGLIECPYPGELYPYGELAWFDILTDGTCNYAVYGMDSVYTDAECIYRRIDIEVSLCG